MSDLLLLNGLYATPDRYAWSPATGTAVLSDVHLGVEQTLASRGLSIPPAHLPFLRRAWERLCARLGSVPAGRLIIAGDLFDSPVPEESAIDMFRALLAALPKGVRVNILPGNHDPAMPVLQELVGGREADVMEAAAFADFTVIHGHRLTDARGVGAGQWQESGGERRWIPKVLIVGHQHPAVVLRDRVQSAKMICFAAAKLHLGEVTVPLIVLPAFSHAPLGSNLLTARHWILDLPRPGDQDVSIAGIVGERVLDFRRLDRLG